VEVIGQYVAAIFDDVMPDYVTVGNGNNYSSNITQVSQNDNNNNNYYYYYPDSSPAVTGAVPLFRTFRRLCRSDQTTEGRLAGAEHITVGLFLFLLGLKHSSASSCSLAKSRNGGKFFIFIF